MYFTTENNHINRDNISIYKFILFTDAPEYHYGQVISIKCKSGARALAPAVEYAQHNR